jgi:hypothetical protein
MRHRLSIEHLGTIALNLLEAMQVSCGVYFKFHITMEMSKGDIALADKNYLS